MLNGQWYTFKVKLFNLFLFYMFLFSFFMVRTGKKT